MVDIQPWAGRDRDTLYSLREPPELDEHMREILTKVGLRAQERDSEMSNQVCGNETTGETTVWRLSYESNSGCFLSLKHQKAEEELAVTRCHLQAQEETIEELRAALQDREIEAARMHQELNRAREELQKQVQPPWAAHFILHFCGG